MEQLKELERYKNHEFSSSAVCTKDYLDFQRKYIKYITNFCNQNNWNVANITKGHYEFSLFIEGQNKHYIYLKINDVRTFYNDWYDRILVRTALNEHDYCGGKNQYSTLPNLEEKLKQMLKSNLII